MTEQVTRMVYGRLGMQDGGRTGGELMKKGAYRVSLELQVGEKQLGGKSGGVVVMKGAVWLSLVV